MKKLLIIVLLLFLPSTVGQAYEQPVAGITVPIETLQQSQIAIKRDVPIPFFIYQVYTFAICQEYEVDYDLVLAIMDGESSGKVKAFNTNKDGTHDKGLMQINSFNYEWLEEELGVTDFYNPYQNIHCGVFMIADLMDRHTDLHTVLMSYNMGEKRTRELHREGVYTSKYSRKVMGVYKKLKEVKG